MLPYPQQPLVMLVREYAKKTPILLIREYAKKSNDPNTLAPCMPSTFDFFELACYYSFSKKLLFIHKPPQAFSK